jgi:hypothetical protein
VKKFICVYFCLIFLLSCAPKGVSLEHALAPYIAKYGQPIRLHTATFRGGLQTTTEKTFYWKNDNSVEVDSFDIKGATN